MTTYYWLNSERQDWYDKRFNFRYNRFIKKGKTTDENEIIIESKRFALKAVGIKGDDETLDAMQPIEIDKWFTDKRLDSSLEFLIMTIENETDRAILFKTTEYLNPIWFPKSVVHFKKEA